MGKVREIFNDSDRKRMLSKKPDDDRGRDFHPLFFLHMSYPVSTKGLEWIGKFDGIY